MQCLTLHVQVELAHGIHPRTALYGVAEPYTLTLHLHTSQPGKILPRGPAAQQMQSLSNAPCCAVSFRDGCEMHGCAGFELRDQEHEVQLLFGVSTFLLLSPGTYTGRIMKTEACAPFPLLASAS